MDKQLNIYDCVVVISEAQFLWLNLNMIIFKGIYSKYRTKFLIKNYEFLSTK